MFPGVQILLGKTMTLHQREKCLVVHITCNTKDLEALPLPTNAAIDDLVASQSPRPPSRMGSVTCFQDRSLISGV